MNITIDCLPCFVRHTVEVLREFTDDEAVQEYVLREILRMIADLDFTKSPPEFAAEVHALIRKCLHIADPYRKIKDDSNRLAESLYPILENRVRLSDDPLKLSLLYAIAGNIIDSGVSAVTSEDEVLASIEMAENICPAIDHSGLLFQKISEASNILILGDNAGEIVFDRLFLQQLKSKNIFYAVKGAPILNDALREDALWAGIDKYATILDTAVAIPGTVLEKSSPELNDAFRSAEVILAKGQANYETLSDLNDPRLFFALRAKCSVISRKVGVRQGSFVVMNAVVV